MRVGRIIVPKVIKVQTDPITMMPAVEPDHSANDRMPSFPSTIPMVWNSVGRALDGIHAISEPATMALKITSVHEAANANGALRVRLASV